MLYPFKEASNSTKSVVDCKNNAGNYGAQCRFWSASPPTDLSPLIFTWMDGIVRGHSLLVPY